MRFPRSSIIFSPGCTASEGFHLPPFGHVRVLDGIKIRVQEQEDTSARTRRCECKNKKMRVQEQEEIKATRAKRER